MTLPDNINKVGTIIQTLDPQFLVTSLESSHNQYVKLFSRALLALRVCHLLVCTLNLWDSHPIVWTGSHCLWKNQEDSYLIKLMVVQLECICINLGVTIGNFHERLGNMKTLVL